MLPAEISDDQLEYPILQTLEQVAQALDSPLRAKSALQATLEILERDYGVLRSAIVLRRAESSELHIEASRGLSPDQQLAFVRAENGPLDTVLANGRPVLIPRAGLDSPFVLRTAAHLITAPPDTSFFCLPILIHRLPAGAFALELRYEKSRSYDLALKLFGLIASLCAQAIRISQLASLEKSRPPIEIPHTREVAQENFDFSNLIGTSGPMRQVYEQLAKVVRSNATVMVRGESGTGKELIAEAIHNNSARKDGPFIKVNCAALPDALIESELFGYEKGAFTGAQALKKGRFELAEGGTLFLDEIGELNATTSVKLLRVLQEREFERVGGTRTIKTDVRLIVATNKDLEKAILDGTFRDDLFYRLNVFSIFLPPLRERKPDVLLLADHFLNVFNRAHQRNVKRISTPAIDMLMSYHWPGNVRELANTIERAVLICDEGVIHGYHLPPTLQTAESTGTVTNLSLKHCIEAHEKDLIQDTLKTTRGNRARAAKLLQTTERIINYKVKKYRIDCTRFS